MKEQLLKLRFWYEQRDSRERLLILVLSWAILYFLYYYLISSGIYYQRVFYQAEIAQRDTDINALNKQIANINKLKKSKLYQDWQKSQLQQKNIDSTSSALLKVPPEKQWQRVFNVILQSQPNVGLIEIKNLPEKEYNPANVQAKKKYYAQTLIMTVQSDYLSFLNYSIFLESQLPMLHWNKLHYDVTQYPLAKIDMEFSILYEKTGT